MKYLAGATPWVTLVASMMTADACQRPPQEYSGVGPWDVTRTTLADATGRCDPADLPDGRKGTYCYLQPMLPVAEQAAEVDLYFGGTEPTARLIEIQLKVRVCDADKTEGWLRTHFGLPYETTGDRAFFKNRFIYLAAKMDRSTKRCMLRIFPLSEQAELERAKAG